MAVPRLPFLWPMLARGVEATSCSTNCACPRSAIRTAQAAHRSRALHTSRRRRGPEVVGFQRYGTANEPPPLGSGGGGGGGSGAPPKQQEPAKALPKIGERLQRDGEIEVKAHTVAASTENTSDRKPQSDSAETSKRPKTFIIDSRRDASESEIVVPPPEGFHAAERHPMESVLESVPDPSQHAEGLESRNTRSDEGRDREPPPNHPAEREPAQPVHSLVVQQSREPQLSGAPHMDTPRHVHHFDTYSLVQQLSESGFSNTSAITIMKAMRLTLAENIDLARAALVSKSQVENETYLFRAACAELKTEATARRRGEQEQMRAQRTHLQHEVDMLSQRVGQESGALKDELKGMFDDRRMAVRNEQRGMDSKIQRLNYRITVDLQADAKSDVEGLRWVMTRRVIIAIGVVVVMVLGSLKLYSNVVHERELAAKRRAKMKSQGTQASGDAGSRAPELGYERSGSPGTEIVVQEGDNPAFVSLG